jgi:hypothetical protein
MAALICVIYVVCVYGDGGNLIGIGGGEKM